MQQSLNFVFQNSRYLCVFKGNLEERKQLFKIIESITGCLNSANLLVISNIMIFAILEWSRICSFNMFFYIDMERNKTKMNFFKIFVSRFLCV